MPPRDIIIHPVLNGYSVKVGCQTLVFESAATLLKELKAYLAQPKATELRYAKTAVNKTILGEAAPPLAPYNVGTTITYSTPQYNAYAATANIGGSQGAST